QDAKEHFGSHRSGTIQEIKYRNITTKNEEAVVYTIILREFRIQEKDCAKYVRFYSKDLTTTLIFIMITPVAAIFLNVRSAMHYWLRRRNDNR
ncbi:MAG: hypothetical protein PHO46_05290, partial [Thermoguttaceae bacterium]|nr:hypothetical protein [Thermoguttaceae bacterium]